MQIAATALSVDLERRLARLTQLLRAEAELRRSVASLLTLRRLADEGPLRVTALAAAELVAQPTMTGIVGRLADEGLVERLPDPDDARALRVALTDAGRAALAHAREARAAVLQARIDRLDDAARETLAAVIPVFDQLLSPEDA